MRKYGIYYLVFTLTGSGGGSFKFMPGNTNLDPLILLICANLVGVVSCMAAILLRVSPSTKHDEMIIFFLVKPQSAVLDSVV